MAGYQSIILSPEDKRATRSNDKYVRSLLIAALLLIAAVFFYIFIRCSNEAQPAIVLKSQRSNSSQQLIVDWVIVEAERRAFVNTDITIPFLPPIGGRFNCSQHLLSKSAQTPTNAEVVRPADIKYIAAMGESLMTGFRSYSFKSETESQQKNVFGNSFITGGDGRLHNHLTLANAVRYLNPDLQGYSTGKGLQANVSQLNMARPGKWSSDMPRQARELIQSLSKYPEHSVLNDWKLITMYTGTMDISMYCIEGLETTKEEYKRHVTEAIRILQAALPRTIISLIGLSNVDFIWFASDFFGGVVEGTFDGESMQCTAEGFKLLGQRRIEEYREAVIEIVNEFNVTSPPDQAVISLHIFDDLWKPLTKADNSYNADFYAIDLFHFSNYGNSLIAKQVWNQLISPDSFRITNNEMLIDDSPDLKCPEEDCPYIRTPRNSEHCGYLYCTCYEGKL